MNQIGVIGMAVMGRNLALNIADHNYQVAIYNRTIKVTDEITKEFPILKGYQSLEEFVSSLEKPRKIILMVKAGDPVDLVLDQLTKLVEAGDIIMDGGNSNFHDTKRRFEAMAALKINYLGVGISGGEEGARFGPAIMPGGSETTYKQVAPILEAIAAKVDERPCVSYIGDDGAGHYVKMVHNGIEYADMQIIAESYSLLKHLGKLDNVALAQVYDNWNRGELQSYLIEITAKIFQRKEADGYLIDKVLDKAAQKGTGLWTVASSLDQAVNASMIAEAVYARIMSSQKDLRIAASQLLENKQPTISLPDNFVELVRQALYVAKIISYAQGFDLMTSAAKAHHWKLNLSEIALNFRGGCIIRAKFLNRIAEAYLDDANLKNLILAPTFLETLNDYLPALRSIVSLGALSGISLPVFSNALSYFDGLTTAQSNANLIQAQRDFFGAHTVERNDMPGVYHYEWE